MLAITILEMASPGSTWGIWAEGPLEWDSTEYRVGQLQFENGGLSDAKRLLITGDQAQGLFDRWCDHDQAFLDSMTPEETARDFFHWLVEEGVFEEREENS